MSPVLCAKKISCVQFNTYQVLVPQENKLGATAYS